MSCAQVPPGGTRHLDRVGKARAQGIPKSRGGVDRIVDKAVRSLAGQARDDCDAHGGLLHEGTIGLAEAIDRYDMAYAQDLKDCTGPTQASSSPSSPIIPKGARLGTYATYWIRARIVRAIQSREHAFRFPEHALQASHRLVRAAQDMGLKWDVVAELALILL